MYLSLAVKGLIAIAFAIAIILALFAMLPLFLLSNSALALSYDSVVTFSPPTLKFPYSPPIASVTAGQQVVIATTASHNIGDKDWDLIAIIEVRDADGVTKYIAWQSGTVKLDGQMEIGVSWIPEHAGTYQLRTFAITNNWEQPQVLTQVYQSEVTIDPQQAPSTNSIVVLTDRSILRLDGNTIKHQKEVDERYSGVVWDGTNLYLATFNKEDPGDGSGDDIKNQLLVLDRNFNEISSHTIGGSVYDFSESFHFTMQPRCVQTAE